MPWLIGVILLLAGMVIVLLALIFAGDASLGGGGAGGSPTPSAFAFVPAASGAESPTPRPSSSRSAEPSKSPDAIPEYGELEMIYQGRSAALSRSISSAAISASRGSPRPARDPDLDVRRFAWTPDGTRGAFLYADRALAIDPGSTFTA